MSREQIYDTIGTAYTVTRRTEPRMAARIWAALGDARTVVNVGAGTGSYEPPGREVIAVEPSAVMRAQRPAGAAPCVAAVAESLPFKDLSFDAAMAVSTVHHWQDPSAGLREMRRVARRVVVFTHDASDAGWLHRFWLIRDYLPEVADLLVGRPPLAELAGALHTWTIVCAAECQSGPGSGQRPSSGRCAASGLTLPRAGGPSATVTSPTWTRQSSAFACLSPEPGIAQGGCRLRAAPARCDHQLPAVKAVAHVLMHRVAGLRP